MDQAATLRPLGIGDIVDRAFSLVRSHPLLFAAVAVIPQLLITIATRAITLAGGPAVERVRQAFPEGGQPDPSLLTLDLVPPLAGVGLAILVVGGILYAIQSGAVVEAVARRYLGEPVTARDAFAAALRATPRLIGATIVVILLFLGLVGAFVLVGVGLAAAATLTGAGALVAVVIVIAVPAFVAALLYATASLSVVSIAVVREGAAPWASVRRSWGLARGARWRILGLIVLLAVLQGVIGLVLGLVLVGSELVGDLGRGILQEVVNLLIAAAFVPLQWGAFTILYYDLRVRREGLDLQLAAEALSRST